MLLCVLKYQEVRKCKHNSSPTTAVHQVIHSNIHWYVVHASTYIRDRDREAAVTN